MVPIRARDCSGEVGLAGNRGMIMVFFFFFSKLKFKQLNGPTNRSTINLTKSYLHSMCMRTMYKCLNACMYVVHRVT